MLPWRRSSGPTARRWALLAAIALAAVVAYSLRWAVAWVLDGILRVIWFVDALPQVLVWVSLLVVLFALTIRLGKGRQPKELRADPEPARSDLAQLVHCIRQADLSPHARSVLQKRLGRAAVALRLRREPIPPRQAWDDVTEGRWPADSDLQAVLLPERGRARLVPRRGYTPQLARAVDWLWTYAKGGDLDGNSRS